METLYLWCAVGAGTVFVVQTVLALVGIGSSGLDIDLEVGDIDLDTDFDTEFDAGHDAANDTRFVGALSIKAIIAGITVFGLAGLAADRQLSTVQSTLVALCAGAATMYAVGWLIHRMHQLNADGTVRIGECVGSVGSVYLTIPEAKSGVGKVTVEIQGRTMEYAALTEGDAIPTGTQVQVAGVLNNDTIVVRPTEFAA
mgnify:CR=1 FL=1